MAGFDEFPLVSTDQENNNNFESFPEVRSEKPSFLEQAKSAITSREALQAFGATAGSVLGTPFGPAGIIGGGIFGAEAGNVLTDFLNPEEAPKTIPESLKRAVSGGEEEITAQAFGATLPPVLKGAVKLGGKALGKLPIVGATSRAIKRSVVPFTESGGMARAEKRVQEAVTNPSKVADRIVEKSKLTPAQQTGEKKLLEIEQSVIESSAGLSEDFSKRSGESIKALKEEIEIPGNVASTAEFLQARQDRVVSAVETRKNIALDKAEQSISKLLPELQESQSSSVVREELEKAFTEVKGQERALWDSVPKAGIHTKGSRKAFKDLTKDLSRAQLEDIPDSANKFLNPNSLQKFKNIESLKELQGLRSKLLEESRVARAAGSNNKARIADTLSDAILDDLGAQSNNIKGEVGRKLREALDFSRIVREKFSQGSVGRVLRPERTGADKVAPELTLQSIIGAGKVKGDVGIEQLLAATDTPETKQAVEQYIMGRLNSAAVKGGKLNVNAAEKFIKENVDTLDKFPSIRNKVTEAVKHERDFTRALGFEKKLSRAINNSEKSAATKFLKAPVEKEIDSIFSAKNPSKVALKLKRITFKSKEASSGLKAGVMENIINKSYDGIDDLGNEVISGKKLFSQINNKRKRPAIKIILGEERMKKLDKVASDLIKIERSKSAGGVSKIIDDTPNMLINAMATTFGARFGAKLGSGTSGASLKTASFMSNQANKLMKNLTADKAEALLIRAFTEPDGELLKALLTGTKTEIGQKKAAKLFNNWMTTAGARVFINNEQKGETK